MESQELDRIYNFLPITESIATGGQPTKEQFDPIKNAGYELVINLALFNSTNAIPEEKEIVENLDMDYLHIPVVWENPTQENFTDFCAAMENNRERKVFVHCAMNMRVSAFIYLYRILKQNIEPDIAILDLHKIWQPNDLWQSFIDRNLPQIDRDD
jgi:protein tyrosine phosphatase (PTP) superfamily phosphohydrolase (DUF442 family)